MEGRLAPFVGLANALIASCSVLGLPYLFAIVVALILRERYKLLTTSCAGFVTVIVDPKSSAVVAYGCMRVQHHNQAFRG